MTANRGEASCLIPKRETDGPKTPIVTPVTASLWKRGRSSTSLEGGKEWWEVRDEGDESSD